MSYEVYLTPQAQKDAKKILKTHLKQKVIELIETIKKDPFAYPPKYEILQGALRGKISRRINKQHRLVYEVLEDKKAIKIYRMWTHYE